ncbi:MAG TPA: hypothetical protein VH281_05490 [Gaiellaceae bacterium]|jgi:hypothetical protein
MTECARLGGLGFEVWAARKSREDDDEPLVIPAESHSQRRSLRRLPREILG